MGRKRSKFPESTVAGGAGDQAILDKKLTVGEAKHMLRNDGGALSVGDIAMRAVSALAVSGFSAWAIKTGQATAWHLLLPMLAEYFVLLIALPGLNLLLRDREMARESRKGGILLVVIAAMVLGWVTVQSFRTGDSWADTARAQWAMFRDWIVGAKIHWAILAAALSRLGTFPGRVAAYRRLGPPFMPIGIGCAMRIAVFALGVFLVPFAVALFEMKAAAMVVATWAFWGLILLSEGLALWMHLDLQRKLKARGVTL